MKDKISFRDEKVGLINEIKANRHKQKLFISTESIDKPISIIEFGEVKK